MRRSLRLAIVLGLALSACTPGGKDRELARYYDPQHLFSTRLPAANTLSVVPPAPAQDGPSILSGVVAEPPAPSPSPRSGFGDIGGGLAVAAAPPDQTVYEAFAVGTEGFESLSEMAASFVTTQPAFDVREQGPIEIDGAPGRLYVVDAVEGGTVRASLAVALTLGRDDTGFLIAAIFPPGGWDEERADFLRVVDSFETDLPPVLRTYPLAGATP